MKEKKQKSIFIKFIFITAVSLIAGGMMGYFAAASGDSYINFFECTAAWLQKYAVWLLAISFIAAVLSFVFFVKSKPYTAKALADEEGTFEKADDLLNTALNFAGIGTIFSFVFFGIFTSNLIHFSKGADVNMANLFAGVSLFLASLFVYGYLQYVIVEQVKKLYPEKQGNVLDAKFQKDWYESCDEAERYLIGKASYTSHKAVSNALSYIFIACIFLGFALDIGVVPYIIIGVVMFVQTQSYYKGVKSIKNKK